MKRSLLAWFGLQLVLSCGVDDQAPSPGSASAGTAVDAGGSLAAAGSNASGGSTTSGGSGGNAPVAAGAAGKSAASGTADSGAAGSGGSGTGGSGTGGGGGDVADVVGKLDGFLFIAPCGDSGSNGYDCANSVAVPAPQNSPSCQGQDPKTTSVDFPIAGESGKVYDVTVHVYGVTEAKTYTGGTRRDGNNMNASAMGGDFWYSGGSAPDSTYNIYQFHVTPPVAGAENDYFLNSRNDTKEGHESWALNYSATFPVTGGGQLNLKVYDANCRQIMNCGPGAGGSTCKAPRTLDLSAASPPPPSSFRQPFVGGAPEGATGQWLFIDVTGVVAK